MFKVNFKRFYLFKNVLGHVVGTLWYVKIVAFKESRKLNKERQMEWEDRWNQISATIPTTMMAGYTHNLSVDTHHDLCLLYVSLCAPVLCTTRFELDQDRWGGQCLCPSATERIWKGKYFDVCSEKQHQRRWHCHWWLERQCKVDPLQSCTKCAVRQCARCRNPSQCAIRRCGRWQWWWKSASPQFASLSLISNLRCNISQCQTHPVSIISFLYLTAGFLGAVYPWFECYHHMAFGTAVSIKETIVIVTS